MSWWMTCHCRLNQMIGVSLVWSQPGVITLWTALLLAKRAKGIFLFTFSRLAHNWYLQRKHNERQLTSVIFLYNSNAKPWRWNLILWVCTGEVFLFIVLDMNEGWQVSFVWELVRSGRDSVWKKTDPSRTLPSHRFSLHVEEAICWQNNGSTLS